MTKSSEYIDTLNLSTGKKYKHELLGNPEDRPASDLRIAFVTPSVIGSKGQTRRTQPPLGIACIAASIREYGYKNIFIIDSSAEGYDNIQNVGDGFIRFGLRDEEVAKKVSDFNPQIVAISALFSSQAECAYSVADAIRTLCKDAIIIMGGIHASKVPKEVFKQCSSINYILSGEGDFSFVLLCDAISKGLDPVKEKVPGLVYQSKKDIIKIPELPGLNVNELPYPAWDLMNMELYWDIGMPHNPFMKTREYLTIMTERGCPEKCYFCSSSSYFGGNGVFKAMTPEKVFNLLSYIVEKFSAKEIQIEDDTFTLNPFRVIKICELIKPLGLRITLPNSIRADAPRDHKMRLKMFKAMRSAGFEKIGISAEHGDQEFLSDVIGKNLDLNEIVKSIELAHEAGLMVHTNFMMGFPHEKEINRNRTKEFALSLDADSYSVSLAAPLPGTKMWEIVEKDNLFMPSFNVNRLVYDVVNIIPEDIEPANLYKLVTKLNKELNAKAIEKRPHLNEYYKLVNAKKSKIGLDRKYSNKIDE